MITSLNERFKQFISQLPSAEIIDDLELPSAFAEEKRADFLIENRKGIIELKSLESDPEHKVQTELENHMAREEYPLFYGAMELQKVLKHLPDGEQIQKKIFYKISRSIEQSFREADKQIGATKAIMDCPNSFGLLVLLNQDITVLSPGLISSRVSELLTKMDSDGKIHYKNITSVWFILENFSLKSKKGAKLLPSIVIDGPSAVHQSKLTQILDMLQSKWAAFNNIPYATAESKKISDSNFIRLSELEKEHQGIKPRHEWWRRNYRNRPYLRSLSDDAVLMHGARFMSLIAPHLLINGPQIDSDKMAEYIEGWTHFLEEVNFRGLDIRKMPKVDFS
jgi:hypothetical protein